MRKKVGLRALDVERAAYKKLGWENAPKEPVVSEWEGSVPLSRFMSGCVCLGGRGADEIDRHQQLKRAGGLICEYLH